MKLANPFSTETRWLFFDCQYICWKCGGNQQTELHHIVGRSSNSPLNASVLCHECHSHVTHTPEEEMALVNQTIICLWRQGYKWTPKDEQFLLDNPHLLKNNPILSYEL